MYVNFSSAVGRQMVGIWGQVLLLEPTHAVFAELQNLDFRCITLLCVSNQVDESARMLVKRGGQYSIVSNLVIAH